MSSKKNNTILFMIAFGLGSLHFLCNKKLDCREVVYDFEIGIRAFPDKDSINIGDTVWLEVNEPTTLNDLRTGRMIDYSGAANLGTTIGIAELISVNTFTTDGNSGFNFFLSAGKEIFRWDSTKFREYSFAEISNRYEFKLAVIPQKKGVFKMFVSNAIVIRTNDKCTKASFSINFKSTNQHLYFNEIVLPGVTLPPGGGIYLFKVK